MPNQRTTTSVMIHIDKDLYNEYKELNKKMGFDRDETNSQLYTEGVKNFIKKFKKVSDVVSKELKAAEDKHKKTVQKIVNRYSN